MVISKPTGRTLISFSLFLIIAFVLVGMSAITIYNDDNPPWYSYLIVSSLGPISAFLLFRLIFGYKVIRLGSNQIEIFRPALNRRVKYTLEQVDHWTESKVKTGKSNTYKELEVRFEGGKKIQVGHQEYSNYGPMISYLKKKVGKKER